MSIVCYTIIDFFLVCFYFFIRWLLTNHCRLYVSFSLLFTFHVVVSSFFLFLLRWNSVTFAFRCSFFSSPGNFSPLGFYIFFMLFFYISVSVWCTCFLWLFWPSGHLQLLRPPLLLGLAGLDIWHSFPSFLNMSILVTVLVFASSVAHISGMLKGCSNVGIWRCD